MAKNTINIYGLTCSQNAVSTSHVFAIHSCKILIAMHPISFKAAWQAFADKRFDSMVENNVKLSLESLSHDSMVQWFEHKTADRESVSVNLLNFYRFCCALICETG